MSANASNQYSHLNMNLEISLIGSMFFLKLKKKKRKTTCLGLYSMLSLLLFIWNSLPPFNIQSFSFFFFLKPTSLFISFLIIVRQHAEAGLCFHLCLLAVYRYCTWLFGRRSLASRPLCLQTINNELRTHMQPTECTHLYAHTIHSVILLGQVEPASGCPHLLLIDVFGLHLFSCFVK